MIVKDKAHKGNNAVTYAEALMLAEERGSAKRSRNACFTFKATIWKNWESYKQEHETHDQSQCFKC